MSYYRMLKPAMDFHVPRKTMSMLSIVTECFLFLRYLVKLQSLTPRVRLQ